MNTENTTSENTKDQYVYYKMNNKWNIGKLKGQDDQYVVVDDKGEDLAIDKSKKHLYEFKNSNNQKYAVEQVKESLANVGIGKNALQDHELERLSKGEELHYVNSYKNSENKLVEGSSILEMRYGTNGVEMIRKYKRKEA